MNVKDAISAVVTSMKPTISCLSAVLTGGGATVTISSLDSSVTSRLYTGERVKLTFAGVTVYASITTIADTSIIITLPSNKKVAPTACEVVLVFDHGHPLEIVNRVKEYQESDTLKFEAFPRICLFHDFEEKKTFQNNVTCTLVIVTDTSKDYTAAERYTYTFDPILTPLYNLFLATLLEADNIETTEGNWFKHTKIDRLYWGKNGLYGNSANIFNDYIDAIEINNLELIINNC